MFSRCPVDKSSSTKTECPWPIRDSARCDPMKPAPPVMSARTVSLSLKSESEPTDESDTAPEATEAAALEALIHRRAAVHFQKPGGVNPERRFAANRAAELE